MNEIIERWNRATRLWTPEWEHRIKSYNDEIASAIIDSWKDVASLIDEALGD